MTEQTDTCCAFGLENVRSSWTNVSLPLWPAELPAAPALASPAAPLEPASLDPSDDPPLIVPPFGMPPLVLPPLVAPPFVAPPLVVPPLHAPACASASLVALPQCARQNGAAKQKSV